MKEGESPSYASEEMLLDSEYIALQRRCIIFHLAEHSEYLCNWKLTINHAHKELLKPES